MHMNLIPGSGICKDFLQERDKGFYIGIAPATFRPKRGNAMPIRPILHQNWHQFTSGNIWRGNIGRRKADTCTASDSNSHGFGVVDDDAGNGQDFHCSVSSLKRPAQQLSRTEVSDVDAVMLLQIFDPVWDAALCQIGRRSEGASLVWTQPARDKT